MKSLKEYLAENEVKFSAGKNELIARGVKRNWLRRKERLQEAQNTAQEVSK